MLVESCGSSAHAWDRATASTAWTTAATTSRQRGLDYPGGGARPEQAPLAPEQRGDRWRSRVATWAPSTAAAELAWRLLWWCRPCRRTPASRSASSASRRATRRGRALLLPHPLGRYSLPTSRGPPYSFLASRWRRFQCDRRATPSAEPPTRPTARLEPGVPARAGTRDRPVP